LHTLKDFCCFDFKNAFPSVFVCQPSIQRSPCPRIFVIEKAVVFFANVINNEKIIFSCKTKGVNVHAGNLVKQAAIITGGNGGGRPDFAQAGGRDITKVDEALEKVKESL
jgi:alanyl-tRNA synthetase